MMDYLDRVLIKLRRKYSENEVIAALNKKLSEIEVEMGFLKSERDEKVYELDKLQKQYNALKNSIKTSRLTKEIKREELYQQQRTQISNLKSDLKKIRNERDNLYSKLFNPKD